MIKVGIIGCDHLSAAELIRVLINHPDVEMMWVTGGYAAGTRLDAVVPGIVGECDLTVSGEVDVNGVDVIYLCGNRAAVTSTLQSLELPDDVKVIDLSGSHNLDHGSDKPWKYGLGEMQRRVLVHEAQWVTIPGPAAVASLLALMPMARNLLINNPVSLHVVMGELGFPEGYEMQKGALADDWTRREVELALSQCQSSFSQPVDLMISPFANVHDERRTLAVFARYKCGVDGEMIRQLYEQWYDDHNFVFIVDRPIVTADVMNTNKCLISIDKNEQTGELAVHAVMDLLLKGGAGTAVHVMNLMFGLHERVGLALKGTGC